jgi:hypothetical protein
VEDDDYEEPEDRILVESGILPQLIGDAKLQGELIEWQNASLESWCGDTDNNWHMSYNPEDDVVFTVTEEGDITYAHIA